MKKIFLIVLCMFLLIGCQNQGNTENNTANIDEKPTEEEIKKAKYLELSDKLLEYMQEIYNKDEYMNGTLEPKVYKVTLNEMKAMGKDISMFINPITQTQCDLFDTYGRFIIVGTTADGKTDYTYTTNVSCEDKNETKDNID